MCSIPSPVVFADLPVAAMPGELERILRSFESARADMLAALSVFDARGAGGVAGSGSTQSWLRHTLQMTNTEAKQHVANARVSRDHPLIAQAHAAGRLTGRQLAEFARAADILPGAVLVQAAPTLLDLARRFDSRVLRTAVTRIDAAIGGNAADAANQADLSLFEQRSLHLSRTFDGMVAVDGLLDPEAGTALIACVEALAAPRDTGDPRNSHPNDPNGPARPDGLGGPDLRTRSQRQADAFTEICTRLLNTGDLPTTAGQKPHITLVVDVPTLTAHTGEGMGTRSALTGLFEFALGPESARRVSCDSAVDTVIVDQPGIPLALGRTARTVSPGQHRALRVRDNGCVFPGCNRPHSWCQAHHVIHWSTGGPTDLNNLVMLCHKHHKLTHDTEWDITRIPQKQQQQQRFQWHPPGDRPPIPAQHAQHRDPLTTLDWARTVARLQAAAAGTDASPWD